MILNWSKYDHCFGHSPQSSVFWNKMFGKIQPVSKSTVNEKLHVIGNVQNRNYFMFIQNMMLILKWCMFYRKPGFPVLCPCTRPGLTTPLQQCSSGCVCDGGTRCCTYVWTQRWQVLYSREFSSRLVSWIAGEYLDLDSGSIFYEDISFVKCDAVSGSSIWAYTASHAWKQQSLDTCMVFNSIIMWLSEQ